ncbi:MAG TPA: DUF4340 domain-containing protein [Isosphaeraceae bacterium]
MKNRGYTALIAIFFAGLIGLWWLDYARVPDRDTRRLSEPRVLPELWEARPDDVQRLEIVGGTKRLVFERRPGNRWQMIEPLDVAADPSLVENLAFNLKMLERVKDAGTLKGDAATFGLAPPSRTIRLYGPSGNEPLAALELGATLAKSDKRYVRPAGSDAVEVVEAARVSPAELPAESWRDRMLVRIATPDVLSLEARRDDKTALRLERKGDLWKMVEPFAAVADEGKVDGLLAEVAGLRVPDGGFVADDASDRAAFGLDKPTVSITLTPRGANAVPQTIHIGKPAPVDEARKDKVKGPRYFARREDQDDVVAIDAGLLKDLGVNPADLHAKKVSDVDPNRVDAIRLTSEGVPVVVAKRPRGWERIAPLKDRADPQAVADLLKKVATAESSVLLDPRSAPDPKLDAPWATLELWQDSGPKPGEGPESAPATTPALTLKLGRRDPLAKSVFAQIGGDPVVLALPSSFLDGLTFGALAFRDRQVASVSPPQVARITVIQGPKEVVVESPKDNNPTHWRMVKPAEGPADPETVGRALFALSNLRAETLVTDRAESDARYGLDKPVLQVKWKTHDEMAPPPRRMVEGEETTLAIGSVVPNKPDQPRYARVSSSPIVFTIGSEVVARFESEWRDRQVFSLDPKATDKITLRWPSLTLTARPAAAKDAEPEWSFVDLPKGMKVEPDLKSLVKNLTRLTTFRYAQYAGPIAPELGLFPPKLMVEATPSGLVRPPTLRLGATSRDGYVYATNEDSPSGVVFLLPLSNWAPWIKPPTIEDATKKDAAKK